MGTKWSTRVEGLLIMVLHSLTPATLTTPTVLLLLSLQPRLTGGEKFTRLWRHSVPPWVYATIIRGDERIYTYTRTLLGT